MTKTAEEIAGDMRAYADELETKAKSVRAAAELLDPPKPKRRGRPPKAERAA